MALDRDAYVLAVSLLRKEGSVEERTYAPDRGPAYLRATLDVRAPHDEAPAAAARLARIATATRGYLTMVVHDDCVDLSVAVSMDLPAAPAQEAA